MQCHSKLELEILYISKIVEIKKRFIAALNEI